MPAAPTNTSQASQKERGAVITLILGRGYRRGHEKRFGDLPVVTSLTSSSAGLGHRTEKGGGPTSVLTFPSIMLRCLATLRWLLKESKHQWLLDGTTFRSLRIFLPF